MAEYYRKKQPSCTTPDGREWFASGGGNTNPEYIEREALSKALELTPDYWYKGRTVKACLDSIPAADVVPVAGLRSMLSVLESNYCGDGAETYTSGYRNGHRNGQIELLRYILRIPDGTKDGFCSYGERKDGDTDG